MATEAETDPTSLILFMFVGLLMGVIAMQILSICGDIIPYTVVIFTLGVCISFFSKVDPSSEDGGFPPGLWGESINEWSHIDAELLLFIFLPPLIFGEAMSLNWFHVLGGFVQSFLLAGPGVIIGALVMGALTKAILPTSYGWSWELAMIFGAILSATDTVAVVSLLKGAGASPKLTIIIVGESLMNDGTAIVMFTVFLSMLEGDKFNFGNILGYFCGAAIGSPLFGVAMGLVVVRWLRSANRELKEVDTLIQIALTIICSYLIFYAAQGPMAISGAFAVCVAGWMLAWLAPPVILNHETMHNVWSMIEWMGNTLIFLLAGLIIGTRTLQRVDRLDWLYVVVLYIVTVALRGVVVMILYPWLSTMGFKCTKPEAAFITWGGLRGAVGVALALIVEKSKNISASQTESSRLFFYVGGIAALSLLIQGTTAEYALTKLGLTGSSDAVGQTLIQRKIRQRLRRKLLEFVSELSVMMSDAALEEVIASSTLLSSGGPIPLLPEGATALVEGGASGDSPSWSSSSPSASPSIMPSSFPSSGRIPPERESLMMSAPGGKAKAKAKGEGEGEGGRMGAGLRSNSLLDFSEVRDAMASSSTGRQSWAIQSAPPLQEETDYGCEEELEHDDDDDDDDDDDEEGLDRRHADGGNGNDAIEGREDNDKTKNSDEQVNSPNLHPHPHLAEYKEDKGDSEPEPEPTHKSKPTAKVRTRAEGGASKEKLGSRSRSADHSHLHSQTLSQSHPHRLAHDDGHKEEEEDLPFRSRFLSDGEDSASRVNRIAQRARAAIGGGDDDDGIDDGTIGSHTVSSSVWHMSTQLWDTTTDVESRADDLFKRMTDKRHRSTATLDDDGMDPQILAYVRTAFLEIVRVAYWHNIQTGKLPRLSHSAQFLLFSIDVGLDSVDKGSKAPLRDWDSIEKHLETPPWYIRLLVFLEGVTPVWVTSISNLLGRLEARREKRAVYILASFIEAHEHAQRKLRTFLDRSDGSRPRNPLEEEEEEGLAQIPEELKVKAESDRALAKARMRLKAMPPETVEDIRTKQFARQVLAKEEDLVREMIVDGLLTAKQAELYFEEIQEDVVRIENNRRVMANLHERQQAHARETSKLDVALISAAERGQHHVHLQPFRSKPSGSSHTSQPQSQPTHSAAAWRLSFGRSSSRSSVSGMESLRLSNPILGGIDVESRGGMGGGMGMEDVAMDSYVAMDEAPSGPRDPRGPLSSPSSATSSSLFRTAL